MDIDSEAVRPILERIAVRGEDDGEKFTDMARVDAIADCLKESSWKLYHDGDLAKIYTRCDFNPAKPVVVVSSHVDMVARRCYVKCDGELWKGSFDNLITNAVIVACMKENVFNGNVLVAFTGDEEADDGFGGADEVAETLSEKGISVKHVVVTDVTEEGWDDKKAFTIENVLPEDEELRQQRMAKSLKEAGGIPASAISFSLAPFFAASSIQRNFSSRKATARSRSHPFALITVSTNFSFIQSSCVGSFIFSPFPMIKAIGYNMYYITT